MNEDEVVERLLYGLRTAEPPAGMERRILQAMQSPPKVHWRLYAVGAFAAAIAAAWCIATIKVAQVPAMPMYGPRILAAEVTAPPVTPRRPAPQHDRHTAVVLIASFPAPPLPLTDQEKLLLRLAHRRDANKEPALNPALHAAQIAKANEQFQHFFNIDDKEMRKQIE